jgi:hypothetical protein
VEFFGINPDFSLSGWLRGVRDATPFGQVVSGGVGTVFLAAPLFTAHRWAGGGSDAPTQSLSAFWFVNLLTAVVGAFFFALSSVDLVFSSHLGTRELVRCVHPVCIVCKKRSGVGDVVVNSVSEPYTSTVPRL